jgi:hypothetical protein
MAPKTRTPSPTKPSKAGKAFRTSADPALKLEAYNIFLERGTPLPPEVQELVTTLKWRREGTPSPNAKLVARRQPAAAQSSEADAIDLLHDDLFLRSAKKGGHALIDTSINQCLCRNWLPTSPTAFWGPLEQPRPDTSVGYIKHAIAQSLHLEAPFTEEMDRQLRHVPVASSMHFPFFTCQWKSARCPDHPAAKVQGARDGALLVNYMRWFYRVAGQTANAAESAHFSATCDVQTLYVYVHWADGPEDKLVYHMERIFRCFVDDETSLAQFRVMIRNLNDYAVGSRLDRIRAAAPAFIERIQHQPALIPPEPPYSDASTSASVAPSVAASVFDQPDAPIFQIPTPRSEADSISGSSKKRKTGED